MKVNDLYQGRRAHSGSLFKTHCLECYAINLYETDLLYIPFFGHHQEQDHNDLL